VVAKLNLKSQYDSSLVIDGASIDVHVRRMSNKEFDRFAAEFARYKEDGPPRGSSSPATPEQQEAFEEERRLWMKARLSQDLTIGAGQIAYDGRDITNGGELLDLYGGRADVVPMAIALIWMENHLSEAKKKRFRSQLASSLGSLGAPPETAPGDAPASTVASADPKASADPAPATDGQPSDWSGTTDPTLATEALASA
jgi:hypothetical protein